MSGRSCSYQPLPFTDDTESFFRPKFFRLAVKLFRFSFVGVGVASPEAGEAGPLRSTSLSSTDCESSTITTSFCIESSTVPETPPPPTRRIGAASASASDSTSSACIKTGESSPAFAADSAPVAAAAAGVGVVGDVGISKSGIGAVGDAACIVSGESVRVLEGGEAARAVFVGDVTGGETTRRGVTEAAEEEADDVSNSTELPASRSSGSCCAANEGESNAAGVGSSKGNGAGGFVTEIVGTGGRGAECAWFVTFPSGS